MLKDLHYKDIFIRSDARKLSSQTVNELAEFAQLGTPFHYSPLVRTSPSGYELLAGAHRVAAYKQVGRETFPCDVLEDISDQQAELISIDENLQRKELTATQRARSVRRRQELYEILHPETKQGGDRSGQTAKSAICFAEATSKATGTKVRTIRKDSERGKKVHSDVLRTIEGTVLDKGIFLDEIKHIPRDDQMEIVIDRLSRDSTKRRTKSVPSSVAAEDVHRKTPNMFPFEHVINELARIERFVREVNWNVDHNRLSFDDAIAMDALLGRISETMVSRKPTHHGMK